jgi:hypothetical protein
MYKFYADAYIYLSRAGAAHTQVLHEGRVPPACLALNVVKGVVRVPKHCMQYAMVQQVLGEAKQRGGVRFAVTK